MQAADIPTMYEKAFGESAGGAFIRTVPVDSQVGIDDGAASYETGFPPINFIQVAAGGIPPDGRDVNGVLYTATQWLQWLNAGGPMPHNAALSAAIGGYPLGAILASDTFGFYWISEDEDNVTDPDAGGAGSIRYSLLEPASRVVTASTDFTLLTTDTFVGLRRIVSLTATSITLPTAARVAQEFTIEDLVGNFSLYPITVIPPAANTIAGQPNWTLNMDFQSATFRRYDGDIWSIK